MHTLKTSSKIVVFSIIGLLGVGIFFAGKNSPVIKTIKTIQKFKEEIPKTPPNYLGEIISKEGNLISIKYFETQNSSAEKIKSKDEFISFLKNASMEEKIKMRDELKQKVLGNISVQVPLNTSIYEKKKTPTPINFSDLEIGNFIVIWGNLNEKEQVIADFILTANPQNYEKK